MEVVNKNNMGNILKKYGLIIAVVATAILLVIMRLAGTDRFKQGAGKLATPSINMSNIVTPESIKSLKGHILVIGLDDTKLNVAELVNNEVMIKPESLLLKENLSLIRKNKGPVLILSTDRSIAARVWMVLNQMGVEKIFIFAENMDDEVLKYKFRPDTTARPESEN
jgi:hypothetical protein